MTYNVSSKMLNAPCLTVRMSAVQSTYLLITRIKYWALYQSALSMRIQYVKVWLWLVLIWEVFGDVV